MIFVDGVYLNDGADSPVFHPVPSLGTTELQALVLNVTGRIGRMLENRDMVERCREHLCRHISRSPRAVDRLALTSTGRVRFTLETPYREGNTLTVLEPLDLMASLAALVPLPRMH